MTQKLVLAFPLYRTIDSSWFFNFLEMDKTYALHAVATNGVYLSTAMRMLVDQAFDRYPDFDRLVVMEQDMIPPLDGLNRIANYRPEHDIVGSVYFQHEDPHHVMAWQKKDPPCFSPFTRSVIKTMVENPALYPVDGVGMGFTAISRHVFEEWNPDVSMWDPAPPFNGQDMHFCWEATKPQHGPNGDKAFRVWLDSGNVCGHLTPKATGYQDFLDALAGDEPDIWEPS